ncbi:hypothetical protein [Enterovibrio calviensis]|uniref:hypothetical protein n=1 Tax=Enterovibrio calviensis TaxID=91359 RepID=UPI0004890D93|nr:hypothetical protein [Enterovibrio calviensis]
MKSLSLENCDRDIAALDAAEMLTNSVKREVDQLKNIDTKDVIKRVAPMMMTGSFSLEALGLPANLFEKIEQLDKLNGVARQKLRGRIETDRAQLLTIIDEDDTNAKI